MLPHTDKDVLNVCSRKNVLPIATNQIPIVISTVQGQKKEISILTGCYGPAQFSYIKHIVRYSNNAMSGLGTHIFYSTCLALKLVKNQSVLKIQVHPFQKTAYAVKGPQYIFKI